jgi:hypothetical protein
VSDRRRFQPLCGCGTGPRRNWERELIASDSVANQIRIPLENGWVTHSKCGRTGLADSFPTRLRRSKCNPTSWRIPTVSEGPIRLDKLHPATNSLLQGKTQRQSKPTDRHIPLRSGSIVMAPRPAVAENSPRKPFHRGGIIPYCPLHSILSPSRPAVGCEFQKSSLRSIHHSHPE